MRTGMAEGGSGSTARGSRRQDEEERGGLFFMKKNVGERRRSLASGPFSVLI